MARLRDLPAAIRVAGPTTFVRTLGRKIVDDRLTTHAAAVAYAWLFALFPFLIFLLTLVAYVPEKQKVNGKAYLGDAVQKVMARDAATTILDNLNDVMERPHSGLLSVGILVTLWVASGGMSMTMTALDAAYNAGRSRPFYVKRPLAILLTVVITAMFLAVFVLLPVGTFVERWMRDELRVPLAVIVIVSVGRYLLAFLLMMTLLALLYRYGTCKTCRFSFFSPGSLFTVLVWFVLGLLFRVYVDRFGQYQKTYGTVGGVTIILLFFYLDALVLLIGAEINSEIDQFAEQQALYTPAPQQT